MATKTQQESAVAKLLADQWEQNAKKIAELARALPEGKLEWTPTAGVRSYGGVLRHVAFWNRYVADRLNRAHADDTMNELPIAEYSTKAQVLDALDRTSRRVAAALRAQPVSPEEETLELAVTFLAHNAEHYGQLAVYARLMGLVPPASRG